ncbi:MAG: hypothetical protein WDZ34_01835 [Candidatus Saccharimonadales bacterium]
MNEAEGAESLLLEVLGVAFLMYVLNATEAEVIARFTEAKTLNAQQEESLSQLLQFIKTTGISLDKSSPLWHLNLDVFASQATGHNTSCANVLRTIAGGTIEVPKSSDKILGILYQFAGDFYSLFLIPKDKKSPDPFQPTLSNVAFRHSRKNELENAILTDKALVKLFGNEELSKPAIQITGYIHRSTGQGGSIQLVMLPEIILRNAWHLALLGSKQPDLKQLCDAIKKTVRTLRAAADGKKASIPVRVAFTGVVLPKDKQEIKLPWGVLRSATDQDENLMPAVFADGAHSTTTVKGETVTVKYSGDVILETEMPYRAFIGSWNQIAGSSMGIKLPAGFNDYEVIQKRIEAVEIGLLFATQRENERPRVVFPWRAEFDPLGFGHSASWRNPQTLPLLLPARLTQNEVSSWEKWIKLIDSRRVPSVEVAIHRILLAETERKDPVDVLIDAVIAWENLVGSPSGEPTLRVSASLAWLLGKDSNKRAVLQSKFSKLYNLRSRVVHGSGVLTVQEATTQPQEAVKTALEALREIFDNKPELLKNCKDSTERSKKIILQS